jgi:hypothetical protein
MQHPQELPLSQIESNEKRLVVIPHEIEEGDSPYMVEALARGCSLDGLVFFTRRNLHFNTHSLRYAQITQLNGEGQVAAEIAKISHHANLNFILDYTQQRRGDETLMELEAEAWSMNESSKAVSAE